MGAPPQTAGAQTGSTETGEAWGWSIVLAAAAAADSCAAAAQVQTFAADDTGQLRPTTSDAANAVLTWRPGLGWQARLPADHSQRALIDLYLPLCSATPAQPMAVGHLGQSLDGFIATHSGDSQYVTGPENLRHMHRMRALCDAIIVGAGTVAADDPQLTTRHVAGPSPVRVIFDPTRRLAEHYRVFNDDAVETIYVCGRSLLRPGERRFGRATIVGLDDTGATIDAAAVLGLLRERGCHRIFIEGGGVTVSMFLEAGVLDRLHIAIAPVIIGDGRPAIRLRRPPAALGDCHRPRYSVFRMGGDVLFDCSLREPAADGDTNTHPPLQRIV